MMAAKSQRNKENKRIAAIKAKEAEKQATMPQTPPAPVQVVEHRQTVTVQATWQMTQEMRKTNELLTLISNKLAAIVEDLYGTKEG